MSIKISELPSASSVASSDVIPIVQSGTTKKATVGTIMPTIPTIATSITSSSTNEQVAGAKAVYDYGQTLGGNNYSTTEQVVGTWINGKPLYEKTYVLSTIPQVTTDGTAADIKTNINANADYGFLKIAFAISQNVTYPNYQTLPYISNSGRQLKAQLTNNNGNLAIDIVSNGTAYNNYYRVVVVVNYTKNTDTATRGGEQLKSINTGSLVGMGDRAEITLEKEGEPEEITETKSAEVDKLESEEGSGDSR